MDKLTYIICGKLYNGIDAEFKENYKILVKNDLIEAVGPDIPQPESAEVIDLSDATVTPGMIDAHMHMDYIDWHTIREEVYTTSEEAKTLAIVRTAQKSLSRGFTTVRHPGGISSNGLGELSNMLQNVRLTLGAGKDFFVNAVREEVKYGADFIKIMATGGFFTPNDNPSQQQLNDEELQAIMNTAHEWGKTVTAHVYSVDHMQKLIKYGIDGMEHCSLMDEETAQMIIDHDVYVVPTFCPYEEAVHYDPVMIQTKQKEYRIKLEYYKDALQAGREVIKNCKCKLGYGTDMVATHQNYESGYEFKAWMESGMGTFRTLHAATQVNSEILQLEDKIGTLEPGKYADIAAWKRDLMTDPYALLDCAFVMKEGVVYSTERCEELTD